MIRRILLAVDDTVDSVAAARVAIELASALQADLLAVHAGADHELDQAVEAASGLPGVATRRAEAGAAVLTRVAKLAAASGLKAGTEVLKGDIAPAILDKAGSWSADLLILGKSARSASGEPYIGSKAQHVLEFAEQPVLIVSARSPSHG